VLLVAAATLPGCGGHGRANRAVQPLPKLPRALAVQLSGRSQEVAGKLEARDTCGAQLDAIRLQQETIAAINGRRVPHALQETLQSSVNDLASRIHCLPRRAPSPAATKPRRKGKGNEEHRGRNKGEGD
jgi:hypothetical protein